MQKLFRLDSQLFLLRWSDDSRKLNTEYIRSLTSGFVDANMN